MGLIKEKLSMPVWYFERASRETATGWDRALADKHGRWNYVYHYETDYPVRYKKRMRCF